VRRSLLALPPPSAALFSAVLRAEHITRRAEAIQRLAQAARTHASAFAAHMPRPGEAVSPAAAAAAAKAAKAAVAVEALAREEEAERQGYLRRMRGLYEQALHHFGALDAGMHAKGEKEGRRGGGGGNGGGKGEPEEREEIQQLVEEERRRKAARGEARKRGVRTDGSEVEEPGVR